MYNFWILSTLCSHPPLEKSNNWPIKANCFTIQETPIFGAHVRKFGPETTHNHHHLLFEHIYTLANAGWKLYQLITTILEARFLGISSDWKSIFFVENFSIHNRSTCPFPASILNNFFRQCMPYLNGSEMGARASTFASYIVVFTSLNLMILKDEFYTCTCHFY